MITVAGGKMEYADLYVVNERVVAIFYSFIRRSFIMQKETRPQFLEHYERKRFPSGVIANLPHPLPNELAGTGHHQLQRGIYDAH